MKRTIIYITFFLLFTSCKTSKQIFRPYKVSIPKGFRQLSKGEANALVKTFAGNFKNVTFYNFYLKDSIALGLLVNKNKNPDYDVKSQVASNHQFRLRNEQHSLENDEKYEGCSTIQNNGLELLVSNYHSNVNGDLKYYKSLLTQTGDDVLRGLVVFSKADSVNGEEVLQNIIKNVKVKP